MATTSTPTYPTTTFEEAVDATIYASNQLGDIINGDGTTEVTTTSGNIPSVRKAMVDNLYFKDPIAWSAGTVVTVFNQLYTFSTATTSGIYYAPGATETTPVTQGTTPEDDPNWVIYTIASKPNLSVAYPYRPTSLTVGQTTFSPPYEFNYALLVINGAVQTYGDTNTNGAYTVADNVITLAEPLALDPLTGELPEVWMMLSLVTPSAEESVSYSTLAATDGVTLVGNAVDKRILDKKLFFSTMVCDGTTDDTNAFLSDMTNLQDGSVYIANPGTAIITSVIVPSKNDVIFLFNGCKFKLMDGHSPLDNEMIRFTKLVNCEVHDFYTDGNRDNVPDTTTDDSSYYGRCLNWRLGNGSQNVKFFNLTMVNSLYCGSQWGNNINNVEINGITFDNIGEHVFYISGSGGGLTKHVIFKNILGGSWGINTRNTIENHETVFVKSSITTTVGENDDWIIENGYFNPSAAAAYASAILTQQYLLNAQIKNIFVNSNVSAIIYPNDQAGNLLIDKITPIESASTRLLYSNPSGVTYGKWIVKNVNLPYTTQIHCQLIDEYEKCIFSSISTTQNNTTTPSTFSTGKQVIFKECEFTSSSSLNHIEFNFIFKDCQFQYTGVVAGVGQVDSIGSTIWASGKFVEFSKCRFDNTTGYSVVTQNTTNSWLKINGCFGPFRNIFNRSSTTIARLEMNDCTVPATGDPLTNCTPVTKIVSNLFGSDGTRNFCRYKGTLTIASLATTASLDLSAVIAGTFDIGNIIITPTNAAAAELNTYVSLSSKTVTLTSTTAATASSTFSLFVSL